MKILMVCLGNICRSPMAEGILRHKLNQRKLPVEVDSAGTGDYHTGEPPDHRAIATAKQFGVDISKLKARQFTMEDFDRFNRIYVMDLSNRRNVLNLARTEQDFAKVSLLLDVLHPHDEMEVPDPWYGGPEQFKAVYNLLDAACDRLFEEIESTVK